MLNKINTDKVKYGQSVYYDKSRGKWRGEICFYLNGKRIRETTCDKNKDTLNIKLEDLKRKIFKEHHIILSENITFGDVADEWINNILKYKLKDSSYDTKTRTYKNYVKPYLENTPISEITYWNVQSILTTLNEKQLSYSVVKKAYLFISGCIDYYIRAHNPLMPNPCSAIVLPEKNKKEISEHRYFNEKEREAIMVEARRTYKNGAPVYGKGEIIIFLMFTGLRYAELSPLTWDDVDFDEDEIDICKSSVYTNVDGNNVFVDQDSTKTFSGVRTVPLLPEAKRALLTLRDRGTGNDLIMHTKFDKKVTPGNLNRTLARILRNAGIIDKKECCGVHTLRHTYATMLFESGVDLKNVSTVLGHSSIGVTSDIYTHVISKKAAKKIKNEMLKYFQ